jgi:hypothetical protein
MASETRVAPLRADARANHAALVDAAAVLVGQHNIDLPYDEIALAAGQFEELFHAWVHQAQDRSRGVDLLTRSAPEEDLRRARRRFEATLRRPTREAQAAGVLAPSISARDVRIVLMMLSGALRSTESAGDRRRAVELAHGMLLRPGPVDAP